MTKADLYDDCQFCAAVHHVWTYRKEAGDRQRQKGEVNDVGLRAGVTSGKQFEPFETLVADIVVRAGLPRSDVRFSTKLELPGFYRAEKRWDVLAIHEDELVAAVEFKSIQGSYGNNLNNRSEEAIGNARDLLTAYGHGLLPKNARPPWLGFVFVMQEDDGSTKPVGVRESNYPVDTAFKNASYIDRAELLCRRLVQKRLYSAATLITSDGSGPEAVSHPAEDLSFRKFAAGLNGRVKETLA